MSSQDSDSDPPDQRTLNSFGVDAEQQAENDPLQQRIAIGILSKSHVVAFFSGILVSAICALAIGLPTMLISISGISSGQFARSFYTKHNNPTHPHWGELDY